VTIAPILDDTMSRKKSIVGGLLDSWRAIGGRRRETSGEIPALDERRLEERRRDPRLILAGDEGLHLLVENVRLRVCDLSTRGFSVHVPAGCSLPQSTFNATMIVGDERVGMNVRPAGQRGEYVGCEIESADSVWHETAQRVLDPLLLGQQLREIDPRFVAPDRQGNDVRWFQGGPACDLFVWHDAGGTFVAAQLFFMGQVVEWSPEHGIRTGTVSVGARGGHSWAAAELFNFKNPPDDETLSVARRILGAATLPNDVRDLLK
jgi:hypothetical protein